MHTLHGNYENLNHFYMCFRIGWSIVKKKSDPYNCVGRNFVDKEKEEKTWEKAYSSKGNHLCLDPTVEYRRLVFIKNRVVWGERDLHWGLHMQALFSRHVKVLRMGNFWEVLLK